MPHNGSSEIQDCQRTIAQLRARIERLIDLHNDLLRRLARQEKEKKDREMCNIRIAEVQEKRRQERRLDQEAIRKEIQKVGGDTRHMQAENTRIQKSILQMQQRKYGMTKRFRNPHPFDETNEREMIVRDLRHHTGTALAGHISQGGAVSRSAKNKTPHRRPTSSHHRGPSSKSAKKTVGNPRLLEPEGIRHGLMKNNILEFFHLSP